MALSSTSSTSSSSPCAACKFLRRKCRAECVFAPYFPPDQPLKFVNVHKVFGASNVTKLLKDLPFHQREDAANSLAYEADMRLRYPVYGCVGVISQLHNQLRQVQLDLALAKSELAKYQTESQSVNHVQNMMINTIGSLNKNNRYYHHHHYCYEEMFKWGNFNGSDNYETSFLTMNMISKSKGQLNNQIQPYNGGASTAATGYKRRHI